MTPEALKDYVSCVKRFPLERIQNERQYKEASKHADIFLGLINDEEITDGEWVYWDALTALMKEYINRTTRRRTAEAKS